MTAVELDRLAAMLRAIGQYPDVAARAQALAAEIRAAITEYAVVTHPRFGTIYAYEVDCFASHYIMDDANVPSLLALPDLGFVAKDDPVYLQTRSVVLSRANPYYFVGSAASGIGGPHKGIGYIWPMGLAIQVRRASAPRCSLFCAIH